MDEKTHQNKAKIKLISETILQLFVQTKVAYPDKETGEKITDEVYQKLKPLLDMLEAYDRGEISIVKGKIVHNNR